jgi:inner membrane protein involved in colicin E2 resistance
MIKTLILLVVIGLMGVLYYQLGSGGDPKIILGITILIIFLGALAFALKKLDTAGTKRFQEVNKKFGGES